ncbi:MAG: hypothetical protein VKP62_13270 [Candidatus Sericytochromatia bacterium]|nr:hypothetical protein [Candidatus Sericytochromatia bacterium]
MKRMLLSLAAGAAITGCGAPPATTGTTPPVTEAFAWEQVQNRVEAVRLARLTMYGPGMRQLLQLGPLVAYSPTDIGSIRLILLRDTGGVPGPGGPNYTEVARNIRNNTAATPYTNTVAIGNLKIGATYVVRSEAFLGANATGEQIDTMVASDNTSAPFTAPGLQAVGGVNQIDTTPQVIQLPCVLKNKVFSGQASDSDGVGITNGTIENNSAAETISP